LDYADLPNPIENWEYIIAKREENGVGMESWGKYKFSEVAEIKGAEPTG
jgi:hypothetical protein